MPRSDASRFKALRQVKARSRLWLVLAACSSYATLAACEYRPIFGVASMTRMEGASADAVAPPLPRRFRKIRSRLPVSDLQGSIPRPETASASWDLVRYGGTQGARVLVAQTSSNEKHKAMLDASRPTNEAYASRHGFDYLSVVGNIFGNEPRHAAYNKAFILDYAMESRDWDYLFYLDADAVVVNDSFDPVSMLKGKYVLAACRGVSDHITWDINNGVFVFALKHPDARLIARPWIERCLQEVTKQGSSDQDVPGDDQTFLHDTLQHNLAPEDVNRLVVSYVGQEYNLFNYEGPNVKHFLRNAKTTLDWSGDTIPLRLEKIKAAVSERGNAKLRNYE